MAFFCIHCKSEIDSKFKACPFCGEAITDFLRRYLETPIDGKYQILSRLGVGGMGEVYKVLHIHLNAIRVIKLMRAQIAGDSGATERFLREARLATRINHPSVATLFDFSALEDGSHYMVWEFIEGTNLHELIDQRGPLSPRYAAKLAAQALHGLDSIHRAGIVHRDISPENLMITHDNEGEERVKIIDLGIAKQWDTEDTKTKTGMFVGKWKYCSPEHLGMLQPGERIDGRADLYSFGIVLYEMLTGVPPFQADTPHAYLMMHSSERPRAMRDVNPGVTAPPELEAIIQRALEKDRTKRYATAREFAQAIERIAPALTDAAGAPPPLPLEAEVTNESTRVAPRFSPEAATVVSIAQDAPTVATVLPGVIPSAVEGSPALSPRGRSLDSARDDNGRSRAPRLALAAIVVIVFSVAGWLIWRRNAPAPADPVAVTATQPSAEVPAAAAHLGINAFPWANVKSIRNLDNGQNVELGVPLVTPAPIELAPGRYEVTLSNPNYAAEITRTVAVEAGRDEMLNVQFSDPRSAKLPDFGGTP
jgi:serine/threonine protein kinase